MYRLKGLIAATYTPIHDDGRLNLEPVPAMVDRLIEDGLAGLYVCGSTGEGMSLTGAERKAVAEAFVSAAAGRVPVIVQVGHNSVTEAAELAAHAQQIGADVISATAPGYYKVDSVEMLAACMAQIAASAPDLPFYYYHIPALTGVALDMLSFLRLAGKQIGNLAGIKYTCPTVQEYQACLELDDGRFDILWGCDEMLLSALVVGAQGAVGSTYNIAAPFYRRILDVLHGGGPEGSSNAAVQGRRDGPYVLRLPVPSGHERSDEDDRPRLRNVPDPLVPAHGRTNRSPSPELGTYRFLQLGEVLVIT